MRVLALAALLSLGVAKAASAQDLLAPAGSGGPAQPGFSLRRVDPAIEKAVRETLAEAGAEHRADPLKGDGPALRGDATTSFGRKFDEAEVPSCWRPDAMKHQPPHIGPIGIGGIYALPFWAAAILRGKCNQ